MMLNKQEALFLSLVGTKVGSSIPRFAAVQNELMKHVLPPIPFLPNDYSLKIEEDSQDVDFKGSNWNSDAVDTSKHFFPLSFRRRKPNEPWYTFPWEPMINISGKNDIIKRKPAKAPNFIGTVKERWSQDDYSITITGSLIGMNMFGAVEETFPKAEFEKLRDYCTAPEGLEVLCEPLQLLGINYLVIEDFSFPFTKGENVQAYELTAVSDFSPEFLLEIE